MQPTSFQIEACVTNYEQSIIAYSEGAHRLEVCSRLETEGMTPDEGLVKEICNHVKIPVRVMVRETEAGYEANENILNRMIGVIHAFKVMPIGGFVFGILINDRINRLAMEKLLRVAYPLPVTFHKAIDLVSHAEEEIKWMNAQQNIDTILTSGGAPTALEGKVMIRKMKDIFSGDIMAGGKITSSNIDEVHHELGLSWYHGRQITPGLV